MAHLLGLPRGPLQAHNNGFRAQARQSLTAVTMNNGETISPFRSLWIVLPESFAPSRKDPTQESGLKGDLKGSFAVCG